LKKIAIIDDEPFDYKQKKLAQYLVKTSYHSGGLQKKHIEKVIKILM